MIDKIDYGDLYKFRTSVGLIIMALALVLPWLIINQDKSFYLSIDEYNSLGNQSKWLADYQRTLNIFFTVVIPVVSLFGLWFGFKLFQTGYNQWKIKQESADEFEQLTLEIKRLELKQLDNEEADLKAKDEVENDLSLSKEENVETIIQEQKDKLINVENAIFEKIKTYNTFNYHPYQNLKFQNFTYDIVLKAFDSNTRPDIIIDVRYLQNEINMVNVRQNYIEFVVKSNEYRRQMGRKAKMYYFLIYNNQVGSYKEIDRFRIALSEMKKELSGSSFTILFLEDTSLSEYDITGIVD